MADENATMYFKNMPRTLRDMFNAAVTKRGKTMKSELIEFMRAYVAREQENKLGTPRGPNRRTRDRR